MPTCSASSERTLQALLSEGDGGSRNRMQPLRLGPVAVKLEDPVADVEELLERYKAGAGRMPSQFIKNQRGRQSSAHARPCCVAMLQGLERRLRLMGEVSEHVCPGCGAKWAMLYGIVKERANAHLR